MKNKISLKKSLILLVVICWVIPVTVIFLFMTISYRKGIIDKTDKILKNSLKQVTYAVSTSIEEAITISKKISYDQVFERYWRDYKMGRRSEAALYADARALLLNKFRYDSRFVMSCIYLTEDTDNWYFSSRSSDCYKFYEDKVHKKAMEITIMDSSDAHVVVIEGNIYIIRNLYTIYGYEKYGTMVLEIDKSRMLREIGMEEEYDIALYINSSDSVVTTDGSVLETEREAIYQQIYETYDNKHNYLTTRIVSGKFEGYLYERKFRDYHLGSFLIVNRADVYNELQMLNRIMVVIWLILVPIFMFLVYFIQHNITMPIGRMTKAFKTIEEGDTGYQIDGEPMPNEEFDYLALSFNEMSKEVKYLFDFAYNEQLARKDAKIIALQSQINPHFLNNTLEMMNWQARMAGDMAVSKMIEALGTLLDYSMDRRNRKLIPLSEELRCAEAYFYIISMRFGKRLTVEKEIDESLLSIKVPQLILQPILENAVSHGVEKVKSGKIKMRITHDDKSIYLCVQNTGDVLTEEDMERIRRILSNETVESEQENGQHVSLGIRNVNERIKLIYGNKYGLEIEPNEDGLTEATITLPFENVEKVQKINTLGNKDD